MKWAVDRIEDDIVVLQNIETREVMDVEKNKFDFNVTEGMIVQETPEGFIHDEDEENIRKQVIADKFSRLKKQRD